jgi:hypothetical protein
MCFIGQTGVASFLFLGNCLDPIRAEVCVAIKEDKDGGQ